MKKILFLLICSTLLLSACGNNENVSEMSEMVNSIVSLAETIKDTNETADILKERMEQLTDSDEYANSERNEQYRMAEKFVESLKNEGLAENIDTAVGNSIEFTFGKDGWGGFIFYNTEKNLSEGHANASEFIDTVLGDRRSLMVYHNYIEGELSVAFAYLGIGTAVYSDGMADDEKMYEADEKIKEFLESDEYKNADKDKKAEMALSFLEELQNDGLIQHYDYFENNEMISYNHFNGALGGISFRDFNETIDGEAMN